MQTEQTKILTNKTILVTGGAGYIGSHLVLALGNLKANVLVVDNLSTGFKDAVLYGDLIEADVTCSKQFNKILSNHKIDAIIHLAAHIDVSESIINPLKYYKNNTISTLNCIEGCKKFGIKNLLFSSTAAVYGPVTNQFVSETCPTNPIHAYGKSKLMAEKLIEDCAKTSNYNYINLRYFNVAGSHIKSILGQRTQNATQLIKAACEYALGLREHFAIFGADYSTPDGTCIRDFIHVQDLVYAHLLALNYLFKGGNSTTLNCGYGKGYSVKEVISIIEKLTGKKLKIENQPKREGDAPAVIAKCEKIQEVLGWSPEYDDLSVIIKSQLDWENTRFVN